MWYIISVMELEQYLDEGRNIFLIDMRDEESYRRGHIAGAVNLPGDVLWEQLPALPGDRLLVLYCYHGPRSMLAAKQLAARGYEAADVYGGILAYRGKHLVSGGDPGGWAAGSAPERDF